MSDLELGLGLISLGRQWATRKTPLTIEEGCRLLETATGFGIRFLDTAPSYASSEEKLGVFLRSLPRERLDELFVATKCGEDWIEELQSTRVDHSYEALRHSIDRSFERLSVVHLLQIHKSTAAVLEDKGVLRALDYARDRGVRAFGASVKDLDAARRALANPVFSYIQFPFNLDYRELDGIFEIAVGSGRNLIINRPLAMGAVFNRGKKAVEAFRFILRQRFSGIVLMGTGSEEHLRQNAAAFREAVSFR